MCLDNRVSMVPTIPWPGLLWFCQRSVCVVVVLSEKRLCCGGFVREALVLLWFCQRSACVVVVLSEKCLCCCGSVREVLVLLWFCQRSACVVVGETQAPPVLVETWRAGSVAGRVAGRMRGWLDESMDGAWVSKSSSPGEMAGLGMMNNNVFV